MQNLQILLKVYTPLTVDLIDKAVRSNAYHFVFVVFEGYECNVTHMPHQASVCMGDPFGYFRLWSQD